MSSKYGKIKTADELEKAILYIKAEQKATGKSISNEASRLLDSLKPVNLVSNLIPTDILTSAGLGLVRGLKKILAAPDSRRKSKKKAVEAEEAVPEAVEQERVEAFGEVED
jgi:hypothetical protein